MAYYDDSLFLRTLESLGVGASDFSSLIVPNTNINNVKATLGRLAEFDKWTKERDEETNSLSILEWTAGGFSVSGYQKITVLLNQQDINVEVKVTSKSKGGQIADWGANKHNVDRILTYLKNPNLELTKRKVPGERKGLIFLIIVFLLAFIIFIVFTNRTSW